MKSKKGITLIALVITIIVLLILAGVSITALTDDEKGVVTKAKEAAQKTEDAQNKEDSDIEDAYALMENDDTANSLANQIDSSNYGDYVNYSKDLGLTLNLEGETSAPTTDWRIFYKDGDRVYLIASDYVPATSSLLKLSNVGMTIYGDYSLYWDDAPSTLSTVTRKDSLFGITSDSYTLNTSNENSRCVSTLLDTANWSNFVDSAVADYAIGGPTIEMYTNSWNDKGYTEITPTSENTAIGYKVNGDSYVAMSGNTGYSDTLYYPHRSYTGIGSELCIGYWLAAPSVDGTEYIMCVDSDGYVIYTYYYLCYGYYVGVRPVVALNPGVIAEQDSNGVWQLDV